MATVIIVIILINTEVCYVDLNVKSRPEKAFEVPLAHLLWLKTRIEVAVKGIPCSFEQRNAFVAVSTLQHQAVTPRIIPCSSSRSPGTIYREILLLVTLNMTGVIVFYSRRHSEDMVEGWVTFLVTDHLSQHLLLIFVF